MNHSFIIKNTKRVVLLFILFLLFFYSLYAELKPSNKNNYLSLSEEINFGRLLPISFKYTVSSCVNQIDCGHNLFDSNRNTQWISSREGEEESIIIDFYSKRLMNSLQWEFSSTTARVSEIQVQVLNRGEWKTIQTAYNPALKGFIEFPNIDASILKINFLKQEGYNLVIKNISLLLNDSNLTSIPERFTGYALPISNAIIPDDDYSLPGAPRKYRNGVHKGLDINNYYGIDQIEQKIKTNTPVYAIKSGEIVRVDHDYSPMTLAEHSDITQYNQTHPVTYVDKDFGGRQIWIDHKNGVMSSYNHLSSISPNVKLGGRITKGELLGNAGNSGLLGEAKNSKEQIHLHLEIWIDGEFLGNDLKPYQSKKFLQFFFTE
jgi:murein DD-endopeptidase MepM/ murein hydrolase activator NlpD